MHQDNLSSVIYRSLKKTLLVSCQDSEQHIDCGAIRKSIPASHSAMAEANYSRRIRHCMKPRSFSGEGDGKKAMTHGERNKFQLMQMPSETRRLDYTPHSSSKAAPIGDVWPKFIAEDLLRGALELQESISVLQNLRDSPKFIVPTRRRSKGKYIVENEDTSVRLINSCRYEANGWQGSRHCVNVSLGNHGEEVRNLIRDGLCRQNLITVSSDDENCCLTQAMSRSNRSIQVCSEWNRPESSIYSEAKQKNVKSPNLIAKLMGLEVVPSETIQFIEKETAEKNILTFPTERLDTEMPIMKRSQSMEQRLSTKKKAFQEIKDTMRHKGLLKGSQGEDHIMSSCYYDTSRPDVEASQIVVMKPMITARFERENLHKGYLFDDVYNEQVIPATKATLKNLKMVSGQERREEKFESFPRTKASEKIKSSISLSHKKKEKKKVDTRAIVNVDQIQKTGPDKRRAREKKNVTDVTIARSQARAASSLLMKLDKTHTPAKDDLSAPKSVSHYYNKNFSQSHLQHPRSSVKEKKKARPKSATEHAIAITNGDSNCNELNPSHGTLLPKNIRSSSKDRHPKQIMQHPGLPIKDRRKKDLYCRCEVMPKPKQSGPQHKTAQEQIKLVDTTNMTRATDQDEEDIKSLLLGSQLFLIYAQEFLHPNTNHLADCQRKNQEETEIKGSNLIIDCCGEILECKIRQLKHTNHSSFLSYTWSHRPKGSMDDLAEKVIGSIQDLRSYTKLGDDGNEVDGLYLKLERDLCCSTTVGNGGWDFGWKDVFPVEETDQVVCDLEQILTAMLVREAFVELLV